MCDLAFMCDLLFCCFFFFKQKTAYEMRISDWSSDVCSSDLEAGHAVDAEAACLAVFLANLGGERLALQESLRLAGIEADACRGGGQHLERADVLAAEEVSLEQRFQGLAVAVLAGGRSEEHTSELQSLMRISYAVFSLKKKNSP